MKGILAIGREERTASGHLWSLQGEDFVTSIFLERTMSTCLGPYKTCIPFVFFEIINLKKCTQGFLVLSRKPCRWLALGTIRKIPKLSLGIFLMVPRRGLEPPRITPLVPKTSAYTNSATWA
jgi:hypothetical protein